MQLKNKTDQFKFHVSVFIMKFAHLENGTLDEFDIFESTHRKSTK